MQGLFNKYHTIKAISDIPVIILFYWLSRLYRVD
ncbi:MAG: hypothetical protein RLY46_1506, partial [Bacteroidota bacterium]